MKLKFILIICVIALSPIYTQNKGEDLLNETYKVLSKQINASASDTIQQRIFLKAYLKKARIEQNDKEIVQGYKNYLHNVPKEQMVVYADSMVGAALKSKDKILISSAYQTKGHTFYWLKRHKKALDNYVIANNYLSESKEKDPSLKYGLRYNTGQVYYFLEQYEEALSELNPSLEYFKTRNNTAYLVILHSIGLCYRSMRNNADCSKINQQGIEKSIELGDHRMEDYFKHSEGINQYFMDNYKVAIESLKKVNPAVEKYGDFGNVTLGHYYIGKSYWALEKSQDAITYLKLVDQSVTKNKYIKEEILDTYDILVAYYKSIGNTAMFHHYQEKQLTAINLLMSKKDELYPKINKGFRLANETREKEKALSLFESAKRQNVILGAASLLLFITLSWVIINYFHKIAPQSILNKVTKQTPKNHTVSVISEEIEIPIIKQLERFEKNKKYLNKDLSLSSLASSFHTNPKHLTEIIKKEKGNKYSDYINELRIAHVIQYIVDSEKKKITSRKLTEVGGYSSISQFIRNFKERTGIPPADYIKKLKKKTSKES